jgi:UDP-N-acetylmuramyl pentapeptide phosphotransferase/UDP-N-acetylglucosamine-1-phosphate transferase
VATKPTVGDFRRRDVIKVATVAFATTASILLLYYVVPVPKSHGSLWVQTLLGILLFAVLFGYEIRAILRSRRPKARTARAAALLVPVFIVIFAWIYLSMSQSSPAMFGETFTRTQGLYFTVTVLSTVGFGDITPKTDPARAVVAVQMLLDLVVIALFAKLLLGAAGHRSAELQSTDDPTDGSTRG